MPGSESATFSVVAEDSRSFTPCAVYLSLESRAEITNVSYRMHCARSSLRCGGTRTFVMCFGGEGESPGQGRPAPRHWPGPARARPRSEPFYPVRPAPGPPARPGPGHGPALLSRRTRWTEWRRGAPRRLHPQQLREPKLSGPAGRPEHHHPIPRPGGSQLSEVGEG